MDCLIKQWRKEAKLSQKELARRVFITPQAISQYENGKREPNWFILEQIAKICNQTYTINNQEGMYMKKLTREQWEIAVSLLKRKWSGDMGLLNMGDDEWIENMANIEGEIYIHYLQDKDPKKSIVHNVSEFFIEEKPLKEAQAILAVLEGPEGKLCWDDVDFFSEHLHNTLGLEKKNIVVDIQAVFTEGMDTYETTILACGYPFPPKLRMEEVSSK